MKQSLSVLWLESPWRWDRWAGPGRLLASTSKSQQSGKRAGQSEPPVTGREVRDWSAGTQNRSSQRRVGVQRSTNAFNPARARWEVAAATPFLVFDGRLEAELAAPSGPGRRCRGNPNWHPNRR